MTRNARGKRSAFLVSQQRKTRGWRGPRGGQHTTDRNISTVSWIHAAADVPTWRSATSGRWIRGWASGAAPVRLSGWDEHHTGATPC